MATTTKPTKLTTAAKKPNGTAGTQQAAAPTKRRCPWCDTLVDINVAFCPECGEQLRKTPKGAKKKKKHPVLGVSLVILGLLIFFGAASSGSSSKSSNKSKDSSSKESSRSSESYEDKSEISISSNEGIYSIGETAEMNNVQVTMTGYFESQGDQYSHPEDGSVFVYAEFDILNNTDHELNISSVLSFDAYADDYLLDFSAEAFLSSVNERTLDGSVDSGKRIRGYIGYEVPTNWSNIEVHFIDSIWGNNKIKFMINRSDSPMK